MPRKSKVAPVEPTLAEAALAELTRRIENRSKPEGKITPAPSDFLVQTFCKAMKNAQLEAYASLASAPARSVRTPAAPPATPARTRKSKVVLPPVVTPVEAEADYDELYVDDPTLAPFKRAFNLASDGNRQCAGFTANSLIRAGWDVTAAVHEGARLANARTTEG